MATLGLLHTATSHRVAFEALVAESDPSARTITVVDESLLADARRSGPADAAVVDALRNHLGELAARGADAIVCTCSTVGGAAATAIAPTSADRGDKKSLKQHQKAVQATARAMIWCR